MLNSARVGEVRRERKRKRRLRRGAGVRDAWPLLRGRNGSVVDCAKQLES